MRNVLLGVTLAGLMTLALCVGTVVASEAARVEKVLVCHAAGLEGTTRYVTLEVPPNDGGYPQGHFTENGTPLAGHEDDYLGVCVVADPTATPVTPTATDVPPADEPTPTEVPPTEENTPTPTPARPTPTDDCIPDGGTEFAPCETRVPTPTRSPACNVTEVGAFFELVGPDGEIGWLGSYQRNPNTGRWAVPRVESQQRCLGFTAVGIGRVRLITRDCQGEWSIITVRCEGGGCAGAYGE